MKAGWIMEHEHLMEEQDWLACDNAGCIAYLSSAGAGPIPEATLRALDDVADPLRAVLELPASSELALSAVKYPRDWNEAARRGFYAYDWNREKRVYELKAAPTVPQRLDHVRGTMIGELARRAQIQTTFASSETLDPQDLELLSMK